MSMDGYGYYDGESPIPPLKLLRRLIEAFPLRLLGTHGITHWARVLETGRRLSGAMGAPSRIVEYFSVLHDARREKEGVDRGHGERAAMLVLDLHARSELELSTPEVELLALACRLHSTRQTSAPLLVQLCWDADRLDLARVGTEPDRAQLCTEVARGEIFEWAVERGRLKVKPSLLTDEWQLTIRAGEVLDLQTGAAITSASSGLHG